MGAMSSLSALERPTAPPPVSIVAACSASPGLAWREALLALLAYAAITIGLLWPVVAHIANSFPVDLGDPPNESWLVAWGVHALTTDPGQLLGGNIYYPHANALIYNDNLLGLLPLSLPIFLLSGGNAALTYNALYLISFALCGLGTFLLARYVTGSTAGAFLAGLIVAFSPYRMVHLSHLNQLSGQWVPLALLCWERARRAAAREASGRLWPSLLGLGLFFVLQALCSIYYAVFLATCLAIYLLVYARSAGWRQVRRFALAVTATACGTAVVLAPFLLPYIAREGRVAGVRGPAQVLYFSADVRDFLHMPTFSRFYGWTESALGVPARDAHQYLFPGLVAIALAWLGRKRGADRLTIRIYTWILVATAIFALGRELKLFDRLYLLPLPFRLLYDYLPGYHSFRDPARFWYIGSICLALLAAWGMGALSAMLRDRGSDGTAGMAVRVVPALFCVVAMAEYWITPVATPRVAAGNGVPAVYHWLKAQPHGTPVLELPIGQQNTTIWSQQALMTYYATYHWQPIVNGVGGYTPDGYEGDAAVLNRWPDTASAGLLARWGVRYVIWHRDWVGRPGPANSPSAPLVRAWPDGTSVYRVVTLHSSA